MPARSRKKPVRTTRPHSGFRVQRRNPALRRQVHRAGQRALRAGTHPQQWRSTLYGGAFARLGPMGALGDDVVIEIDIKDDTILKLGIKDLTRRTLQTLINKHLYQPLQKFMDTEIDARVPSDTNKLREAMHKSLSPAGASFPNNFPFTVVLNTAGIPYAGPVSKMPTANLKHAVDPRATTGWYGLTLLHGRTRAQKLFTRFVQIVAALIPRNVLRGRFARRTPFNLARSTFSMRVN